ncbi:hypothetical protein HZH68_013385 [Vespula germanica]|uniref:Uncharacterized protein n=1 Tax=Vespula germanica TaxID=30212 RepID=A0A834MX22_VESGE|nr:hypothetical protein HZH68_013385 [Vespula germanica]
MKGSGEDDVLGLSKIATNFNFRYKKTERRGSAALKGSNTEEEEGFLREERVALRYKRVSGLKRVGKEKKRAMRADDDDDDDEDEDEEDEEDEEEEEEEEE